MGMNQHEKILRYMKLFGSITVREAFIRLNINNPTMRLSELNRQGLIRKERVKTEDSHYTRYYLKEEEA